MNTLTILFILLVVLVPSFVLACDDIEYAELKDMNKEQMKEVYCKNTETFNLSLKSYDYSLNKAGEPKLDACIDLLIKIEGIYKNKFNEELTKEICH